MCPTGAGKPTKTGQTVLELQKKLPKARIVYASATGASEPKHMAYMVRLGIWGPGSPFRDFNEFLGAVEKRYVKKRKKKQSPFFRNSIEVAIFAAE